MNAICLALMMLLCVQTQNGGGQVSPISAQVTKPEAIAAIERQKSPTCVERDRQNRVDDEIERLKAQLAEQQRQIERLSLELGDHKNVGEQPVSAAVRMAPAVMPAPASTPVNPAPLRRRSNRVIQLRDTRTCHRDTETQRDRKTMKQGDEGIN